MKRFFFHTCENRFVQSAQACVYIPSEFVHSRGKVSERIFQVAGYFVCLKAYFKFKLDRFGNFMFTKIYNAMKTQNIFLKEKYASKQQLICKLLYSYIYFLRFLNGQAMYILRLSEGKIKNC